MKYSVYGRIVYQCKLHCTAYLLMLYILVQKKLTQGMSLGGILFLLYMYKKIHEVSH